MGRYCVGDIEEILFAAFPVADALDGDVFGLQVGERGAIVTRIAIALDQTVPMIEAAAAAGCNLLVSHHPAFWNAPTSFLDAPSAGIVSGAAVFKAAQKGVALISIHTCLDCAPSAKAMLLEPVGLEFAGPLWAHGGGALGQLARPAGGLEFIGLRELATAYKQAFGNVAKVWGDPAKLIFTAAACSGGAGEVVPEVIKAGVDLFVTGELRHHEALYLQDEGIALIELGHDTSELPYRYYLQDALVKAGVAISDTVILEPTATWWQA
jgi:putative NIF3 family GTP cyclohydrolase 1 type 2